MQNWIKISFKFIPPQDDRQPRQKKKNIDDTFQKENGNLLTAAWPCFSMVVVGVVIGVGVGLGFVGLADMFVDLLARESEPKQLKYVEHGRQADQGQRDVEAWTETTKLFL